MFSTYCKPRFHWAGPSHRSFNYAVQHLGFQGVNIAETTDNFTIEVALPGFSKDEVNVTFDNLLLTITAEKTATETDNTSNYNRRGFAIQNFKRSFEVPKNTVAVSDISASLENGILQVTLPKIKVEQAKSESITININ